MIGTVDVTTDINFSSGGYDFAGGNTEWNGFIPTTESLGGGELNNNSPDILLTPDWSSTRCTVERSRPMPMRAASAAAEAVQNVVDAG